MYTRGCAGERLIHLFRVILAVARGRDKFFIAFFQIECRRRSVALGEQNYKVERERR